MFSSDRLFFRVFAFVLSFVMTVAIGLVRHLVQDDSAGGIVVAQDYSQ
ncbi:MAG: hypothetical protein K1X79_12170 [Oligoflexia bacterium]|nr:hypothetical protein [Oligoflexia bacterium]